MRANPFAVLISAIDEGPFASHVPLIIRETGDQVYLRGHVAKANPHWKYLENSPRDTLVIFHGPHAYISPAHYATREVVPTWNYGAVHVYGNARTFSSHGELLEMLHELIPMFEPAYADQWAGLSDAYRERMLGHIVGFEIAVTKVEAKFKLSQNRPVEDRRSVVHHLSQSTDATDVSLAGLMQTHLSRTQAR